MRIPFVEEYWIGATYLHGKREPNGAGDAELKGVSLRELAKEDIAEIAVSSDPQMRRRLANPGAGTTRYGAWLDGTLAGVCTFAFGKAYSGYYVLRPDEAELADIFTRSEYRGRGIAAALIGFGTAGMHAAGFALLYAKIWRNNHAAFKAFAGTGWRKHCDFIRIQLAHGSRALYAQWPPFRKAR
jgi:GNAT superfamily N-acetyltransferase